MSGNPENPVQKVNVCGREMDVMLVSRGVVVVMESSGNSNNSNIGSGDSGDDGSTPNAC